MSLFNTSYLLGNDTTGGWGLRYFFTFYSEFGDEKTESAVEVSVLMAIFVVSVAANGAIAWAVLRYKEMRTVTNCFLLNLTVADLLFASTTPVMAYVREHPNWPFGDVICRLLPYSQFVCGFVLLWTLTLISMDRHRCIVVPPYRSRLTPKRAAGLTVFTWLVASVVFMPVALWFHVQPVNGGGMSVCTLVFPKNDTFKLSIVFTVSVVSLSCVLPLSLFVYHYQRIFPQAEQNAPAARAIHLAPHQSRVAEQPVAHPVRFHTSGVGASRNAQVPETPEGGARAAHQRHRGAGHVAAHHGGHVPHLHGRQSRHGGHGLLSAVAPLHPGTVARPAQYGRQPDTVRRAVGELPQMLRAAVVHIEAAAGHEPRAVGQHEQGWSDAQQRAQQFHTAQGRQFGVCRRIARHQLLVTRKPATAKNPMEGIIFMAAFPQRPACIALK